MIRVECEGCGRGINAPEKYAGQRKKCPGCGTSFTVPSNGLTDPLDELFTPDPPQSALDEAVAFDKRAAVKPCPYCAEMIRPEARKCKHCGEFLDDELRAYEHEKATPQTVVRLPADREERQESHGVAALCSLIIPGAGQMVRGRVISGLVWFFVVCMGYVLFVIPGLVLHVCCIIAAAMPSVEKKDWRTKPPTDAQLDFADDLGIQNPESYSRGELSMLIDQAKQQKREWR